MFRLIKLAMYAFVGYAIYEFVQGMMTAGIEQGEREAGGGSAAGRPRSSQGKSRGQSRMGGARAERTLDADGASVPHKVGRGVI